jgi:hypothetical protein
MLRGILLASPVVLVAVVSCGDSSTTFDDVTGGSAGTGSALGGKSSGGGGKSAQGGNVASAGSSSATGGKAGQGGSNKGGQGNGTGGSSNGGNGNTGGTKNTAGTANGGTASQAGTSSQGGAPSAGAPTDPGGAGNAGEAGMAGAGPTDPLCPDLFGSYKIKSKDGMCNGLGKDAPQSIEGTATACTAHFVSEPPNGAEGVNGAASIDADGNFTGAMLYLDMTQRGPCSGSWDAVDETMTVTCGGPGDVCTVVLELQ